MNPYEPPKADRPPPPYRPSAGCIWGVLGWLLFHSAITIASFLYFAR